jgi:hypothetical protein
MSQIVLAAMEKMREEIRADRCRKSSDTEKGGFPQVLSRKMTTAAMD